MTDRRHLIRYALVLGSGTQLRYGTADNGGTVIAHRKSLPINVTRGPTQLLQKRVSAGSRTFRRVRVRACKRVETRSVQRSI